MSVSTPRKCRCGKGIVFAKTPEGKTLPLDINAPVYKLKTDLTGDQVAIRLQAYVSHFATCPFSDEFSRSKRAP